MISLDDRTLNKYYDMTLMSFKISEQPAVRLPNISNQDGFMTSHTIAKNVTLLDEVACKFVGDYLSKMHY